MTDAADEMLSPWDCKTPITIAGHSLGAGRAALAIAKLIERGIPKNLVVVEFGN
jgi:surfactin synthase thioesterase subunit